MQLCLRPHGMNSTSASLVLTAALPRVLSCAAVILPAGYYAVGAMFVTWKCSNLPGYTTHGKNCAGLGPSCTWTNNGVATGLIMGLQLSAAQV